VQLNHSPEYVVIPVTFATFVTLLSVTSDLRLKKRREFYGLVYISIKENMSDHSIKYFVMSQERDGYLSD